MALIIAEENLIIRLLHTQKAEGKKEKKNPEVYQILKVL